MLNVDRNIDMGIGDIMKKVNVEDAVGMELCHDITAVRKDYKGALYKRGHIITQEDIPVLLDLGKRNVFVWEENADELHEEDCAIRMSRMINVYGTHYEGPSEGKMVLISDERGMLRVDTKLLNQINSIEDITITTLPDHYPVEPGMRLASMRIVPLVTAKSNIEKAQSLCDAKPLMELYPYQHKKVGVIITGSEIYAKRVQDRFEPVVRRKMAQYPSEIVDVAICDDDMGMIVAAAQSLMDKGADVLVFTGGMSVDPDDLTPGAIKSLNADIISHGVPAQPGNMTLVAYIGDVAVLGVPGAAINMPTTIFDVLLPQIFANVRITREELVSLGDGGLCQLCDNCHFPNCTFGRY